MTERIFEYATDGKVKVSSTVKNFIKPILYDIPEGAIKTPVLDVTQRTNFSCGAASLHAVCSYWGVGPESEYDYMKFLYSDPEMGTRPALLEEYAKKQGLQVELKEDMTIADLRERLDAGKPIIILIQAWGNKKQYKKQNLNGHYVVVIGHDDDNIYIEDPIIEGRRGYLSHKELIGRWHDSDSFGKVYTRFGLTCWMDGKPSSLYQVVKIA